MKVISKNQWYEGWVDGLPSLEDKVVAITGCTSGTGYWAAVAAVRKNAKAVLMLNRKSARSDAAAEKLIASKEGTGSSTDVISISCDLMDLASVREAAKEINRVCEDLGGLNVLMNNAGIMMFPDDRTKDGFDVQIQTNHLSHFLLTKLVLPSLQLAAANGGEVRVVQHSSGARNMTGGNLEKKYFVKSAANTLGGNGMISCAHRYHQTKLANSVLMMKLKKEFDARGMNIKSVCAEPGVATTDLGSNLASSHKKPSLLFRFQANVFAFAVNYIIPTQSAPDGSLPLIEAGFGTEVKSGDFFAPEHQTRGKPVTVIAGAETTPKNKKVEALTLSEANQENLWNWTEEVLGEKFFA